VASVGEAALVQPPLIGTAFNETLEYSDQVCSHLSDCLRSSTGVPESVWFRHPLLKPAQDKMQLAMARLLLRGDVQAFDRLTEFAATLPEQWTHNLCSNEMTWADLLSAAWRFPLYLLSARMPVKRRSIEREQATGKCSESCPDEDAG
jgi:hypothetical protein